MNKLFWLIYIQPLHRIMISMILAAVLWGYLGNREHGSRRWRILNAAVFAGIAAVIFYMTVCARGEETAEAVLVPFQNFREAREQPELYRSMLMNVLLFFPIGLSLPFVLGKWKLSVPVTVVLACLSSAGIEYLQYRYSLGRCEVDDVIMNTLGTYAGVRLLPFQTPQDCFAYLRESGYAREALQPSTRQADGSIQNETEKTLWTQWEEGT